MYYYTYYPNRICSPVEFVFIRMYYWKIGYIFNEHLTVSKCTYSSQISYGCTNKAIEKKYKHFHFHLQFVYNERIFPYLFTSSSKEKRPPVYYLLENINLILKKKVFERELLNIDILTMHLEYWHFGNVIFSLDFPA